MGIEEDLDWLYGSDARSIAAAERRNNAVALRMEFDPEAFLDNAFQLARIFPDSSIPVEGLDVQKATAIPESYRAKRRSLQNAGHALCRSEEKAPDWSFPLQHCAISLYNPITDKFESYLPLDRICLEERKVEKIASLIDSAQNRWISEGHYAYKEAVTVRKGQPFDKGELQRKLNGLEQQGVLDPFLNFQISKGRIEICIPQADKERLGAEFAARIAKTPLQTGRDEIKKKVLGQTPAASPQGSKASNQRVYRPDLRRPGKV